MELRLNQSQASAAQVSLQKNQIAQEKKELESHIKAYEREIRQLKQLLEANNIPLIRTNTANAQPSATIKLSTPSNPSSPNIYVASNDASQAYGVTIAGYQNNGINYGPPESATITPYIPAMQGSMHTINTSNCGPNAASALTFATNPTNSYETSPVGFPPFNGSSGFPAADLAQSSLPPAFKDPNDPKFVEFIIESALPIYSYPVGKSPHTSAC